jgi:ribosomal protein S26
MQSVCAPACGALHAKAERLKKERRELTEHRQKTMTLGHRHELTQKDVNAYVVARDRAKGYGCISCGTHTGKPQAGHYLSRGARPGLRYDERNLWLQCYRCNVELSSNAIMYRIELVKRIGAKAVEELEQDYAVKNYTHAELVEIGANYRKKTRDLLK